MEDEYNLSNIIGKRTEAALGELGDLLWAYVVLSKKTLPASLASPTTRVNG